MGISRSVGSADNDDVARFEQLILANRPSLMQYLKSAFGFRGIDFVEAVRCGTESRAWEKFSSYDPKRASFITWLIWLARHVAWEEVGFWRYGTEFSMEGLEESGLVPAVDGPVNRHEAAKLNAALWQGVRSLPPEVRFPFILHVCDGYSLAEVAARLGLTKETVRYRVNLARRLLARRLGRGWFGQGFGTDWAMEGCDPDADRPDAGENRVPHQILEHERRFRPYV
jgi:RNA polymerase sigma factor (sigma-70 family)